jgi:hypothetical protein
MSVIAGNLRHLGTHLRAAFASPERPPLDYPFVPSDVAQLHRVRPREGVSALDEQTWSDLLLLPWLDGVTGGTSVFGKQELYRRLRAGVPAGERAAQRERVQVLLGNPERAAELHRRLRPLRDADTEVAALLHEGECPSLPRWVGRTWPLPIALMASIAAVAVTPYAWLAVALVLYVLMSVQMRYHERVQKWKRSSATLQLMLLVCSRLGEDKVVDEAFAHLRDKSGSLNRTLSRIEWFPSAHEYGDWFALANVNHYFKSVRLVFAERTFLIECYQYCATLDADLTLARHLQSTQHWCWADAAGPDALALDNAVHPLLAGAAPLSISLQGKGAFISGQNGVGKSTFLRTLGLSLAMARAFGFAYAQAARLPDLPLYASMQNEDSLLGGESLYIAELRRARELLQASETGAAAVYLIDEIFRGTNHVESVSAAAAVIDTLAARGLVLVSSHNVVLASLLARWLDPYRIAREAQGLTLRPGVLVETNGVSLLARQDFAPEISDKAGRVAQWLGQRLSEPASAPTFDRIVTVVPAQAGTPFCKQRVSSSLSNSGREMGSPLSRGRRSLVQRFSGLPFAITSRQSPFITALS